MIMTWKDILKEIYPKGEEPRGYKRSQELKRMAFKIMKDRYGEEEFKLTSPRKHSRKMRGEYEHLIELLEGGMSPAMAAKQPYVPKPPTPIEEDDAGKGWER